MERSKIYSIIFLLAIGVLALVGLQYCLAGQSSNSKPASVLMQEALYAEEIEGDLNAAIKIYEQIIKDGSAQRSHVAQAMYREGMCYLKLQNEKQAQEIFQTLVAKYSDQTNIISKVRPLLEDLGNADPAALMPPETLFYAEIGSPGRQVETILKMLEGTPLENPLAMIGGNNTGSDWSSNERSPANMIAALLNPSMMAEFKKIRGMGIGITGIPQEDEPPAIIVLFPGKSDALKGLLTMVLTMAGKPMESLEGMQTVNLQDEGVAVYDDNIVIIATQKAYAAGQLAWSVKQYKGLTNQPTLASSNKSFRKVSKKARQENVLTIWMDTDQIFAGLKKIFPEGKMPGRLRMANGFVDLQSIDDVMAFLSLKETGIAVETNIAFKDGHRSLAYGMIQTPNLTRAGFEAVPSGAVGLISFALGEAESAQAQAVGQRIQNMTGLDIGREIFANIEQVTLFVLPTGSASAQTDMKVPPIATSIGLAITSRNPEQTRQILTRLLSAANLAATESTTEASEPIAGKYQIGLVDEQKLYCYMDQNSKTNVLSLSPNVIEASESAIKSRQSVLTAGPLQEPLSNMSPSTSKLILINVSGALRIVESNMGPIADANNLNEIFAQLATSCDKTFLQLRTDEKLNNLNIRAELIGIPPINNLFVPIMQLAQILKQAEAEAKSWKQMAATTAGIRKVSQAPVIDGQAESLWADAKKYKISNSIYSPVSSPADLSANYRVMCDQENLYLFVDVIDDELKNDSVEFYYDDTVEVFIDADNSKDSGYGENDYTYNFNWDRTSPSMEERGQPYQNDDIKFALVTSDNGYRLEIKFPWSTLGTEVSTGSKIGLDVHVNDDDDGGERDTKFTWCDREDNAWQNPKTFGTAELIGLVGWWKVDETEGNNAGDSSGNNLTGTLMGDPKWQPSGGKIGGALEFDGMDDYVNTDNATDLSAWTVAVWVKSPAAPSSEMPSGPVSREKNYQINWNHVTDEFRGAAGICIDGMWYDASFGELQADTWYHLATTYDDENLKAYKNGLLITTNSNPSGKADSEIETLKFGRHVEAENFFAGTIDDVRIYNYALPQEEIQAFGSVKAYSPQPGDKTIVSADTLMKLSWQPGLGAVSHKIHFGTDKESFNDGDGLVIGNTEVNLSTLRKDIPAIQKDKTYYWCIDSVQSQGGDIPGHVWSFTTSGKQIGWWKFDESGGSIAKNSSGNSNDGAIKDNAILQPQVGKSGGAVQFDDLSSHIEIPMEGMSASSGTVALWAKLFPEQKSPEHRYLFGHTTVPHYNNRIQLYMDSSTTMLDVGLGDNHETNSDMAMLEVNTWHHIALTWNKGTYLVFLNGEELATGDYTGLENISRTANIGNNGRIDSQDQSFNGLIDDVRIYNYALSKNEIKALGN